MAYIILPSRRTRQPQGPARVDWNSVFARYFDHLWVFGAANEFNTPLISIARPGIAPVAFTVVGSPSFGPTGVSVSTGNALDITSLVSNEMPSTILTVFKPDATTGVSWSLLNRDDGPWNGIYGEANGAVKVSNNNTFDGNVVPLNYAANNTYTTAMSFASLPSLSAATDGIVGPRDTTVSDVTVTGFGLYLGAAKRSTAADNPASGVFSLFGFGRYEADESILAELSRNPWQLFAPDPRRIYFGASGGGANIFESTFATSWSLSEAYSASATLVSTYADSPTVTDSSSSSAVFSSAFDETVPVSDGPSADMGGVANRTQEESFTITDAYSASMVANATISETLSAEASLAASAIFNATFAETLPIVDGEEADAGRISDIAENVTVTDAYTAGIIAQATQAESVTTIDTYDTIAIYNPTLEETLPITDAVGATLTVPTSGTVDLSQESIDALALEIMNQLTSVPVRRL